jgi:predicted cation transporter
VSDTPDPAPVDPVLVRRAQVARMAALGQRIGYALFAVAVVAFFIGFFAGFTSTVVTIIVAAMAVGSVALAPAIVASYAVKAADREDREQGRS